MRRGGAAQWASWGRRRGMRMGRRRWSGHGAGLVTEGRKPLEILSNVQEALDGLRDAWNALGQEPLAALRPSLGDRPQTVEMLVSA